ncbi:2-isopropylmalate synthase [Bermanella marisrubri]|uniref:2-isopropylmalate synthase n=1 Tax=Bermanella marisrubri TaxID=207949 RepID=Q1N6M9_9GAMM|nr:2-isopropylmalate synthase [Bermanella marisrubri]EAT13563.1 2-isopropylmalate synthase [Oceanobacter sp. RED65] [Bermanella marisrubri]QIZ84356.1 2-isopropylmalate synthase [Bermanella marisrubri]
MNHQKYRRFPTINRPHRQWPNNQIEKAPLWCAVDLRDGNQALMEPMNLGQKQILWQLLVDMGFKHIEVGFPSASQPDYDFVRWLIEENQIPSDVTIQVLTQARDHLIERTYESLKGAPRAIVHVYNSTSPVQREKVFNLDKQGIIDIAIAGAKKVANEALKHPETDWQFQYSPESFSSTEVEFAINVCNAVINVWQPTPNKPVIINLPATVECATPNVFADQIETFCEHVNQRESIIVSVHTHNDRGCAVAAAELAVMAGADRVEGTLMGNGERTGNMDLVTMAMNLYSQGIDPEVDLTDAHRITQTVEQCTAIPTHARHPWVGDLVYTAFSGSHQDAIRKCLNQQADDEYWDVAYLPIDPKDIGRDYQSVIRVNSQSGKGGVAYILESQYGIRLPRWMQIELSQAVQKHCEENNKEVNGENIHSIFNQHFLAETAGVQLRSVKFEHSDHSNNANQQDAIYCTVKHDNIDTIIQGLGNGSIDAFCHAVKTEWGHTIDVQYYDMVTLGEHSDASALAMMQLNIDGQKVVACATDTDSSHAPLKAIIQGLNRFNLRNQQAA